MSVIDGDWLGLALSAPRSAGFEAVTSIIFCVALSEYDQVLLEESGQNRMQESLVLFESVINSRWFLRTSVILFLNKIDVFKMKLAKTPLEKYFPEYTGECHPQHNGSGLLMVNSPSGGPDINKAAKYILWRFTQTNRARLSVYPHLTQATDTSNVSSCLAVKFGLELINCSSARSAWCLQQ